MNDKRIETAKLVGDITTLGAMVNMFTDFCVFIRFSGHVDTIDVTIAASKDDYNKNIVKGNYDLPTKKGYGDKEESLFKTLNRIKYQLKKILRDHKIDYSKLDYEEEVVRHYKLG